MSKGPFVVKIVICGDGAVGKTALRRRFLGEGFRTSYLQTLGADFAVKTISFDEVFFKTHIWDLAGQLEYQDVRKLYYNGAMGGLVVFDITRADSFENVAHWVEEIWQSNGIGFVPVVFLGNKIDLRVHGVETLPKSAGTQYSNDLSNLTRKLGFECPYMETSAKTGTNVTEAFYLLCRNIFTFLAAKGDQSPSS